MLIHSDRLTLRAAESSDGRFVADLLNSEAAAPAYGPHFPLSAADGQQKLADSRSTSLIAERTQDIVAVGFLRFCLSWGEAVMNIEDVVFDAVHQGKGYGREALGGLLDHFFRRWGGRRAELQLRATNKRALRTYEALGFVIEGRRRKVVPLAWQPDGDRDFLMMGLLSTELREG
ncbi:MAG: GNAT family N-acetyltransferase [Pseudonocardiaceae bacterium]